MDVGVVEDEEDKCDKANDNGRDDVCTGPRINSAVPAETG